jgi:cytochrome c peroxidase
VKKPWQRVVALQSPYIGTTALIVFEPSVLIKAVPMRNPLRNQLPRQRGIPLWSAVVLVAGLTAVLAIVGTSSTTAQGRLAALPLELPAPADNTTTPERVALGRLLFWDPILSGQKDVACATCHHPAFGYTDGLDLSIGANGVGLGAARAFAAGHPSRVVKRNSQTVLNVAFNGLTSNADSVPAVAPMFWDLRVRSLEAQALEPLKALDEMRGSAYPEEGAVAAAVARLTANSEYRRLFARAFADKAPVNERNLGRALAAFERTLVAANSPFDRYMRGETGALDPEQVRGLERFQSTGCINCHNGPMFSDFTAHVLGVPDNPKLPESDSGVNRTYAFRTASLRNLSTTGPYMHNGVFSTLPDVINFYQRVSGGGGRGAGGRGGGGRGNRGGRNQNPQVTRDQVDPLARQLNMRGRGQRDIIAFLRSLDDPGFDRTVPERVPSGLPVGGKLQP